jgi:hypothetical protein
LRKYSSEKVLVTTRECRLGAAFLCQPREREFNVFAGAQFVGRKVGRGAEIVAWLRPADGHVIGGLRLRIADAELGEKRLRADVLQPEHLLAPELAAQRTLPLDRRNPWRRMGSGQLRFRWQLGRLLLALYGID